MRLFLCCCFLFLFASSYGQNQTFWSVVIPVEYAQKQVNIKALDKDIYFFQGQVLIKKIEPFTSSRILVPSRNSTLYSEKSFVLTDVLSLNEKSSEIQFQSRNNLVEKEEGWAQYISWCILAIFALIVFVKLGNADVFYGFLMPWIAYSNTQELVAKMNTRKILMPIFVLWIVLIGNVWVFYGYAPSFSMQRAVILVFLVFMLKIILLIVLEFLFAIRGFSKTYLIEFLKLSIIFSLVFFAVKLLDILNPVNFEFIYKYLLLFYVVIWFSRIVIIFYRGREQKIMYFFSYLCVSEAVPLLLLFAFWNS